MSTIRSIAAAAIASSLLLASGASAQTVSLVEHQGTWGLYADTADPKQVCFVAAQPQAVEPSSRRSANPLTCLRSATVQPLISLTISSTTGSSCRPLVG